MIIRRTTYLGAAVAMALAFVALPPASGDIIVFPDGFIIEGRVREKTDVIFDPASGVGITVPRAGKPFWLDDGVRNIWFSPSQLKDAIPDKSKKVAADQVFTQEVSNRRGELPLGWVMESATEWDGRLEREVTLRTPQGGKFKIKQRITVLTPDRIRIDATNYDWSCNYSTKEVGPQVVRSLVYQFLNKKKENDLDARIKAYRFLLQAGFTEQAGKEVDEMLKDYPKEQSKIAPFKDNIKRLAALQLVDALVRSQKAGLHDDVQDKLKLYAQGKLDDILDETTQLQVQAIKDKHEATKKKLEEAGHLLQAFAEISPPSKQALFRKAAAAIAQELNADTVDRLDTFLNLAADYQRALKDKRQPGQSAAEVMSFAITGFLRGSDAAEGNPDVAVRQWQTRQLLLDYLKTDDRLRRKNTLLPALKATQVSVDEAMQFIARLPPVDAFDKISAKAQTLQTKNDGKQFSYDLQLPPGYTHGRAWPLLIALHHSGENASLALARWVDLAAQHGYIVAVPQWGKGPKSIYQFSTQEHAAVLETLRDLRRRFQIDSDRVFLFGGEHGGTMAFDVGLAHPDQFTGVVPMAALPVFFGSRYWPNAQYLHLYIVNGDLVDTATRKAQEGWRKNLIDANFPAIHIEYKGRLNEWFGAEPAIIFDWMNRKRRAHPLKQVGKQGEEFRTLRNTDNQFYWISTTGVLPAHVNSALPDGTTTSDLPSCGPRCSTTMRFRSKPAVSAR